jgi:hypothetical protein
MFLLTRTMSFKALNDAKRREALPRFLAAASRLEGLTITVAIHKNIKSLFSTKGRIDMKRPDLVMVRGWKERSVERFLRVTHLAALFAVGLSVAKQNVIWITDEDDVVANDERLRTAAEAFGNIVSNLSDHDLGHLRIGTTDADNGTWQLEDLAAIADFTAGALADAMTDLDRDGKATAEKVATPLSGAVQPKSQDLLRWLSADNSPNRHIIIAVDPGSAPGQLHLRRLSFEAIRRPPMW